MAGQVSPGIVLRERDLTTSTIITTQANTAAFVGNFEKGPVGTITNISTEKELIEIFGKPNSNNYEDWFVAQTFLGYGGQLQVVRVEASTLLNATDGGAGELIRNSQEFELSFDSYEWKFAAKTAGSWANGIKVCTIDGTVATYATEVLYTGGPLWSTIAGDPGADDTIHVAVLDASNNILETYVFLSKTAGELDEQGASKYYVDVVNRKSAYVYAAAAVADGNEEHDLADGEDGYSSVVAEIEDAFDLFTDVENINIDFVLTGGSLANEANQVTKAQKAIGVASERKDCIAFVSPHNGFINLSSTSAQRDDIITFFNSVGNSTSYAVFDSGYKYVYDRFNDVYRYVPCNGDVAGLCVEVSANSEDWFSPAGNNRGNLRGVVKLAYVPTKTDRDKLYQARVNPIASFPGQGTVLFGDKTALSTPSAFDRINVRRLFLAVEKRVNQLAKNVLFELNDASTRSYFSTAVTSYLSEVQAKRGVTDYLVVCDETNNTPDVIDRNEFVAEIYLKPSRSINYITLTFVATRTGVSFAEVVGR